MLGSNIKIAFSSLMARRARTILTTIGITIGVASILLVFAAGDGARTQSSDSVGVIPSSTTVLTSGTGNPEASSPFDSAVIQSASVFTERDLTSLKNTGFIGSTAPIMDVAGPVSYRSKTDSNAFIGGTSSKLFSLLGLKFVDGGTFGSDDNPSESVVLGNNVAEHLFGTELASGNTITIRGDTYAVVGVLAASQLPLEVAGVPIDNTVFIPYTQAKTYTNNYAQFNRVFTTADPSLFGKISTLITKNHDNQKDFAISQASSITVDSTVLTVLQDVTAITAALSLVIGGIGIMNIMLVNVSERTREIGIRKSIGASNATILVQFLIEAAVMSFAGGILGSALGVAIGVVGGLFLPFGLLFTPQAILTVLGVSLGIGVLFGLYPAIRAARKDTIEALRYYQ